MATFYEAYRTKEYLSERFLKRKEIVGIGVGYADPKHPKKGAGINVYTDFIAQTEKLKLLNMLSAAVRIKGTPVPIRLIQTGPAFAGTALRSGATKQFEYRSRVRPVPAGYSVSGINQGPLGGAGTVGLIVRREGQLFLGSNNHVLGIDNFHITPTIQPGQFDLGRVATDRIGQLFEHVRLRSDVPNLVDAAISIPLSNNLLDPRYGVHRRFVHGTLNPGVGTRLFCESRTSGLREGIVESIHTNIPVRYGSYGNLGTILFRNQTIIRGRFVEGDSGGVWLWSSQPGIFGNPAATMSFAGFQGGTRVISFPMSSFNLAFRTQVAQPAGSSAPIQKIKIKGNYKYAQPLTQKELSSIEVVRLARRK